MSLFLLLMKIVTYNLNIISKYLYKHIYIEYLLFMNFLRCTRLAKTSYNSIAIFHSSKVLSMLNSWNTLLPTITPYYAIKSFSDHTILSTMANSKYNLGFDIASINEHKLVQKYNKPIIFSHPIKSKCDINYAKKNSIAPLVADSIEEIDKIRNIYPNAPIIWRIKSYEENSTIRFNKKFGADRNDTIFAITNYPEIIGLSFHVGSMCNGIDSYINTIDNVLDIYDKVFRVNKRMLKIVDIGGGFTNISDIANLRNLGMSRLYKLQQLGIQCIAEPGRLFSKNSISLLTKIVGIKKTKNSMDIYINDSIYNSFSGKMFDKQVYNPIPLYNNNDTIECRIWGNTCDGLDIIVDRVILPIPKLDDVLLWENLGAYSLCSSINGFNGFTKATIVDENEL